jgi:two-component system, response regulator
MKAARRILLVEDSRDDVELITNELRLHVGSRIDVVGDGASALDYLHRQGVFAGRQDDAPSVLLDLKLPKLSGFEVLEQIRAADTLRGVPVVVLTSSREDRDIERSYALGANAYVVKPVNIDQFSEAMRRIGLFWGALNETPWRVRA